MLHAQERTLRPHFGHSVSLTSSSFSSLLPRSHPHALPCCAVASLLPIASDGLSSASSSSLASSCCHRSVLALLAPFFRFVPFSGLRRVPKRFCCRRSLRSWLAHALLGACFDSLPLGVYIRVQALFFLLHVATPGVVYRITQSAACGLLATHLVTSPECCGGTKPVCSHLVRSCPDSPVAPATKNQSPMGLTLRSSPKPNKVLEVQRLRSAYVLPCRRLHHSFGSLTPALCVECGTDTVWRTR
uniref:Uncharacterized protein n=1 Tax=uncultured marine microorganism HF4000_48F7 TaxID=455500 RepID=B3SZT0_9ZZZZ|nr:hypothetical protein ALOHA_HF400048F7ctg1g5 [uncultured marine microorganism HF4000_48F7]